MLAKTPSTTLAAIAPTLGAIERAKSSVAVITDWLRDRHSLVDDHAAREANERLQRVRGNLDDLESERKARVQPLNDQVKAINEEYKAPRTKLEAIKNTLTQLGSAFLRELEAKRLAKIEEERKAAAAAMQAALDAQEAIEEAVINETEFGVVDTDFGTLEDQAERSISQAALACRNLARAEHEKVRVGGGFGRVMTLGRLHPNREILTVDNWHSAIMELGTLPDGTFTLPEPIRAAVLTCARAHKKATGDFPDGITQTFERRL